MFNQSFDQTVLKKEPRASVIDMSVIMDGNESVSDMIQSSTCSDIWKTSFDFTLHITFYSYY